MKQKGFSLVEMMVVSVIFMMGIVALGTIWTSTYRYKSTLFKSHFYKNELSLAMRSIENDLRVAGRVDSPSLSSTQSNILAGAINVDKDGCYPLHTSYSAEWFYYCYTSPTTNTFYGQQQMDLYLYRGTIQSSYASAIVKCTASSSATKTAAYTTTFGVSSAVTYPTIVCGSAPSDTTISYQKLVSGITTGYFTLDVNQRSRIRSFIQIFRPAAANNRPVTTSQDSEFNIGTNADNMN